MNERTGVFSLQLNVCHLQTGMIPLRTVLVSFICNMLHLKDDYDFPPSGSLEGAIEIIHVCLPMHPYKKVQEMNKYSDGILHLCNILNMFTVCLSV